MSGAPRAPVRGRRVREEPGKFPRKLAAQGLLLGEAFQSLVRWSIPQEIGEPGCQFEFLLDRRFLGLCRFGEIKELGRAEDRDEYLLDAFFEMVVLYTDRLPKIQVGSDFVVMQWTPEGDAHKAGEDLLCVDLGAVFVG